MAFCWPLITENSHGPPGSAPHTASCRGRCCHALCLLYWATNRHGQSCTPPSHDLSKFCYLTAPLPVEQFLISRGISFLCLLTENYTSKLGLINWKCTNWQLGVWSKQNPQFRVYLSNLSFLHSLQQCVLILSQGSLYFTQCSVCWWWDERTDCPNIKKLYHSSSPVIDLFVWCCHTWFIY